VDRRLTQKVVAKRARMTATTYGKIEKGGHTQTRKLQDIADVFGVPIEDVLQISPLHTGHGFATSLSTESSAVGSHGAQGASLSTTNAAAEVRELRAHLSLLEQQLAEVVAEQESRRRQRSERVSNAGARKPGRPAHARKTR
jgi:DNA-binding XRE family transcriptional regulator